MKDAQLKQIDLYPRHYCPQCKRLVQTDAGRYLPHHSEATRRPCSNGGQRIKR